MGMERQPAGTAKPRRLWRVWQGVSDTISRHSSSLLLFIVFCVVVAVGAVMYAVACFRA